MALSLSANQEKKNIKGRRYENNINNNKLNRTNKHGGLIVHIKGSVFVF